VRAGEDGSAALLFASLAVFDDIVRRDDWDILIRQERHVYAGTCGRSSVKNDIVSAVLSDSYSGSFNFMRQNPELSRQSARLDVSTSPPAGAATVADQSSRQHPGKFARLF
jgi:hypothetical protein